MDITGYAFVTGGGSGLSRATCLAFAKAGAQGVLVVDINLETAQQTATDCIAAATSPAFRAEAIQCDVTQEESVKSAMAHMVKTFGRVDYCVNGAGVHGGSSDMTDAALDSFNQTIDINVKGTYLVLGAAIAAMSTQEPLAVDATLPARGVYRGAIVNFGSIASFLALPKAAPYVASKHAVIGLTKSAAMECAGKNIRVNAVCPSFVDTPLMRYLFQQSPAMEQTILSSLPMGRLAMVEEVADVVLFLCSPRSSYVNGTSITMDGGMTVGPHVSF